MKNEKDKKISIFVRIVIIMLILFVGCLIVVSYVKNDYKISVEIVLCLAILIILALSESFNSFSIGNLIHIENRLKTEKADNEKLSSENQNLRQHISNLLISSNNNSSVNNITYNPVVVSANDKSNFELDSDVLQDETENKEKKIRSTRERRKVIEDIKKRQISKYFGNYGFNNVEYNVQIKENIVDPIINKNVVFSAYSKNENNEVFIESREAPQVLSYMLSLSLYVQLSKVLQYREYRKGFNVKMVLILTNVQTEKDKTKDTHYNKIAEEFAPAISSGLLEIRETSITYSEYENLNMEINGMQR